MEITQIIGYILAILVGISLGLIGSGGSILSVPILVYIMGVEPILATAYSLFVVGSSAFVGGVQKAKQQLVDFKKVILFGIPTILAVFLTRKYLVPSIPNIIFSSSSFTLSKSILIMVGFAVVMVFASYRMIKPIKLSTNVEEKKINYYKILILGLSIGLLAGFVGAGGGFLLIPALIFFAYTPIKKAIGTSLCIIAAQTLIGFIGDIRPNQLLDWQLILSFSVCSILGVFIGNFLSKKINGDKLKTGFGWFVLIMGIYIIIKEVVLS